jgi:hypothetical protein
LETKGFHERKLPEIKRKKKNIQVTKKKKKKNYKNEKEIDGSPQTVWIWPLFSVSI